MSMIEIKDAPRSKEISTVAEYLVEVNRWIADNVPNQEGSLSRVWYREWDGAVTMRVSPVFIATIPHVSLQQERKRFGGVTSRTSG